MMPNLHAAIIYVAAFVLGAALMAFEILVARMLSADFGSGIYTWASVISVVLLAMMVGYFVGGWLVDRRPTLKLAAWAALIAGIWFLLTPSFKDSVLLPLSEYFIDPVVGVLIGAAILQFLPVAALGAYSPIAIRVSLDSVETAGSTAGAIYAVSTVGNVVGTLGAAFYLISVLPISTSIYLMGVICLACAAVLYLAALRFEAAPDMQPAE